MADPTLDFRTAEEFYQQALTLAQAYAKDWSTYWPPGLTAVPPDPLAAAQAVNQDPGLVLLNLFAQLAGYTAAIENQIPNQRRQAFFQFMNMQLRPPVAAQAPLQFKLKPQQPARLVPVQAAVLDAEAQVIRFQTQKELLVVPADLCAAMTVIPGQDQYIDAMPVLSGVAGAGESVALFVAGDNLDAAEQPLGHWFMMGDSQLFKPDAALQSITLTLYGKQLYSEYFGQWFDGAMTPLSAQLKQSADAQQLEIRLLQKPQAAPLSISQLQQLIYAEEDPDAGFDPASQAQSDQQLEYWLLVKPSPEVKVLSSLAQQLPVITGLQCTFKGDAIQPQQSVFNTVLLDITNGAYPFGQTPQLDDAFYIRSDNVFARQGALVSISFKLTPVATAYPVTLYWQFWDGKQWQSFNQTLAEVSQYQFVDTTSNLQHDNPDGPTWIQFQCPAIAATTVAGGAGLWIRALIAAGSYGEAGGFVTSSVATAIDSIPSAILTTTQKESVIAYLNDVEGVNFSYQFNQSAFYPPYIQSLQIAYSYSASPSRYWSYNNFELSRFLFSPFKPVDEVLTGFYFAFNPEDFGNYTLGNKLNLYFYLQQESPAPGDSLLWGYYDGEKWQTLSVDDSSYGLSRSGVVSFTVPADMPAAYLYSQNAYWFRINNPHVDRTIRIYGMYPNTVMASNITGVDDEVLGSSNEQPSQTFQLNYTPLLPTLDLQVIESRGLESGAAEPDQAEAQKAADATNAANAASDEISRQWRQVCNFAFSGAGDRVYTLDCQNGLITFGDGYNGMIPPSGYNNVVAVHYDYTQGLAGNVGSQHLTLLRPGISNIDSVSNPAPARGGVNGDTTVDIAANSPALVKAGGYAVELSELSALAEQSSPQVAQARAIENPQQEIQIALLALSADPVPYTSPDILNQVAAAIRQVCLAPLAARISTMPPEFVPINVNAQLGVNCPPDQKNALQLIITQQLLGFFQPVFGGPLQQGWRFGQTVQAASVSRFLRQLAQVTSVPGLALNGHEGGNIVLLPGQLPVAGQISLLIYLE
jgi:hypothetical protein